MQFCVKLNGLKCTKKNWNIKHNILWYYCQIFLTKRIRIPASYLISKSSYYQDPVLLRWINFNPSMDKWFHAQESMWGNHLTILKHQRCNHRRLEIDGAHLGPTGPRWAPCWPHDPCYLGDIMSDRIAYSGIILIGRSTNWMSKLKEIRKGLFVFCFNDGTCLLKTPNISPFFMLNLVWQPDNAHERWTVQIISGFVL